MKKTKSPKLSLARETLIGLDTDHLQAPRGGTSTVPSDCITCGPVCVQYTIVSKGC